jgi:uncharacterized membrane protein YebE (DUF533 family)
MFLSVLNENEKELFLNLLINAAEVDGDFTDNEKNQINAYVLEMGLKLKEKAEYSLTSDEIIKQLLPSSEIVKKSIFMELTALVLADGMHESEALLLNEVQKSFGFDKSFRQKVTEWYENMMPLYKKGFELAGFKGV